MQITAIFLFLVAVSDVKQGRPYLIQKYLPVAGLDLAKAKVKAGHI